MVATAPERGITQDAAEQDFLKQMLPTSAINRFTTTEEVANMVLYICSEQASGTTGAAQRVDGAVVRAMNACVHLRRHREVHWGKEHLAKGIEPAHEIADAR